MSLKVSDHCCECGNCIHICPRQAVTLQRNANGNAYAAIDSQLCINCQLCMRNCPLSNPISCQLPTEAYAAISRSSDAIYSSSGGIFLELARYVLTQEGVVAGAAYDDNWNITHTLISDVKMLPKLQGSKYGKSNILSLLPKIKEILKDGKNVLFSGTPCQVAALQHFIREPALRNRLITVDLICHGTPPAQLFQDFIASLEERHHGKVFALQFRDKTYGNKLRGTYIIRKKRSDRIYPLYASESPYYFFFLHGLTYTECCYSCPYAAAERCSDITIGDFWNWDKEIPEFSNINNLPADSSISAVMVNTPKGAEIFRAVMPYLSVARVDYEQIRKHNAQLRTPVRISSEIRANLLSIYAKDGYNGLTRLYKHMTDVRRYSVRIAEYIPSGLKVTLKKVLRK